MAERRGRVVAELGRPETPSETAARKAESSRVYRSSQTFRNLIAALLASVAVVLVIAFAVPRRNGRPYLLDFSTGVVANGKIMGAADRGEKIPVGWGLDKDGKDTTDPKAVETLLPLGGAKGAGLSFMIECLTSLLLNESRIAPDIESWAIGDDPFLNGTVIAIDIAGFGNPDKFAVEAERLGTAISGLARAEGIAKIMLPGERGDAVRAEREANGIPIPKGTWQRITKAAQTVGVKLPA